LDTPHRDNDLIKLLKSDVNKGFRFVVETYSSKLYWHIRRLVILHEDADDVLQNTFINAWKNIGEFRSGSSLYTWLYAVATNESLTLINKRKKNETASLDDIGSYFANSLEGSTMFDDDEAYIKLQNAILHLPDKQRVVFNLKYFDKMTYKDMSKVLNTSEGTLAGEEAESGKNGLIKRLRPYLAVAASVAVLVLISYLVVRVFMPSDDAELIPEISMQEFSESYLDDIDILVLEENAGYLLFSEEIPEVSNSEIVDYLLLDNIDINEIYELL
jgi:RNA polymerase sigma factor (sigma-70 family)